ncbi:MAG: hypothetical protein AABY32_06900 [Nanoarchaeota archaeon]
MINLFKLVTGKQDIKGRNLILNEEIDYNKVIDIINNLDGSVMINIKYYPDIGSHSFDKRNQKEVCDFLKDEFGYSSQDKRYLVEGKHKTFSKDGKEKNILYLNEHYIRVQIGDKLILGSRRSVTIKYLSKK